MTAIAHISASPTPGIIETTRSPSPTPISTQASHCPAMLITTSTTLLPMLTPTRPVWRESKNSYDHQHEAGGVNIDIELGMIFCVVNGSDGEAQADQEQSAGQQLHRHRGRHPFGAVDVLDEFRSGDRGAQNDRQNDPREVAAEIQICARELIRSDPADGKTPGA